jgi:phosphoserine phosphatase
MIFSSKSKPTPSSSNGNAPEAGHTTMGDVRLFDLDGVLTRSDTMARLVTRRLRQHPARFLVAVPLFVFAMTTAPDGALRARLNRRLVALALKGLNEPEYAALASNLALELASTPRFLSARAILECKTAAALTRTIIVTASERTLARTFLDALGLTNVELQASELRIRNRATAFVQHNVGPEKLARLRREGVNPALAVLYTDSATDLPLATAVAQTILVNPGHRSLRKFRTALPGAKVKRWP